MEDRRVRRTRAALREALLALMTEKGYEAVTVQDLIDRADIGRSTFYSHFTDKTDLLHDMLTEMRTLAEPTVATSSVTLMSKKSQRPPALAATKTKAVSTSGKFCVPGQISWAA